MNGLVTEVREVYEQQTATDLKAYRDVLCRSDPDDKGQLLDLMRRLDLTVADVERDQNTLRAADALAERAAQIDAMEAARQDAAQKLVTFLKEVEQLALQHAKQRAELQLQDRQASLAVKQSREAAAELEKIRQGNPRLFNPESVEQPSTADRGPRFINMQQPDPIY